MFRFQSSPSISLQCWTVLRRSRSSDWTIDGKSSARMIAASKPPSPSCVPDETASCAGAIAPPCNLSRPVRPSTDHKPPTPGDGPEPDLARRRCRLCRVSLDCRRARLLDDEVDSRKYRRAVRIRVPVRDCSQLRMPVWCGRLRHHVAARLASAVKRTFR
jgi:hypothetical protein